MVTKKKAKSVDAEQQQAAKMMKLNNDRERATKERATKHALYKHVPQTPK